MKKSVKLLLLLVFAFCISTSLNAQNDREKPIKLIIKKPPPHRLNQADLWNITLINSGQSVSAYLFGSMTNNENGELIATGQTMTFDVKKGTTNFKVSDLPKVPDVNYVTKDPKYKTSFMNTGGAPPGDYKICVELRYTNNSVAGEDCIEQKVIGGDAPQLISPRDEEEINNDNPIFTWMHFKGGSDQTYTLRIVELKGNESPENAMLKNKAFFEKEGITQTMLQYPSSANKFEEGKKYVWMVSVYQNGVSFLKSNINYFTNKISSDKKITPTLTTGNGVCQFSDDYSTNTGWTVIRKGSTSVLDPNGISGCIPRSSTASASNGIFVNSIGQCEFKNVTEEGNDYRSYKSIGSFLESSTCWEAKFEFTFSQLGVDNRVGHPIFALTADSPEPGGPWNPINYSDASTSPQSAFCSFSDQDAIMVWLWLPTTAYYNAHPEITPVPSVGTRKAAFFPWCKNGKNLDGYIPTTKPIDAEANTRYYIKLERINATSGRINVYSDPGFTNHVTNSPQCFPIPNGEQITGLNTLQHSNAPDGVGRELTGTLDNTCIKILDPGSISCGTTTPPSNCNSDCKLITANISTCQRSGIQLKSYIGKSTGVIQPQFSKSNPDPAVFRWTSYFPWGSYPKAEDFPGFPTTSGKNYIVKAINGYPGVFDNAYQFDGTWGFDLLSMPKCLGFSQFILKGSSFNVYTRPSYPTNPNSLNFYWHDYIYTFTGNGQSISYFNPNNVGGGSANIGAKLYFYELCDTTNYLIKWVGVPDNPTGATLSNENISNPILKVTQDGVYKFKVKLYCNNGLNLVDEIETNIMVAKDFCDNSSNTSKVRLPSSCGAGFWSDLQVGGDHLFHESEIVKNLSSIPPGGIPLIPKYTFMPSGCSDVNKIYYEIRKQNGTIPQYDNFSGPFPNFSEIQSSGTINNNGILNFIPTTTGKYYIKFVPQGGSSPNIFNCPERNIIIQIN